jgi:hypothetical protein
MIAMNNGANGTRTQDLFGPGPNVITLPAYEGDGLVIAGLEARGDDKYIDATSICKHFGKRWNDFYPESKEGRECVESLAKITRIPITGNSGNTERAIIYPQAGGPKYGGGTLIHPLLALDLARWCHRPFGVWMNCVVMELLREGRVELERPVTTQEILDIYTARMTHLVAYKSERPLASDRWIVFEEAYWICRNLEVAHARAGITIRPLASVDISIGQLWAKYRELPDYRRNLRDVESYPYHYPDGRIRRPCAAYSKEELFHFNRWLQSTYIRERLGAYLVNHWARNKVGGKVTECLGDGQNAYRKLFPHLLAQSLSGDYTRLPGTSAFHDSIRILRDTCLGLRAPEPKLEAPRPTPKPRLTAEEMFLDLQLPCAN